MREVIVIDCETDPFERGKTVHPFIWGAYCEKDGFTWMRTGEEVVEYLRDRKAVVYAHNGGKFDFLYLLPWFEPRREIRIINGRVAKFNVGKAEFRDSLVIMPVPLKAFKKEKMDYSLMRADRRDKKANLSRIVSYLESDCKNLFELVEANRREMGSRLTLASNCMAIWSGMSGIKPPDTSPAHFEKIKPYYFGGRVECFSPGVWKAPINVYDINSAYPFAMTHDHPYGETIVTSRSLPKTDDELSRAFITLRAKSVGAFPFMESKSSGLSFPHDGEVREFKISGWEYIAARDSGSLLEPEVLRVLTLQEKLNFKGYVDHFFKIKAEAKDGSPERLFAKLALNSLYGKFGANPDKYKRFMLCEPRFVEYTQRKTERLVVSRDGRTVNTGFKWVDWLHGGGKTWALMAAPLTEPQVRYYNVATAASITGFVRAHLWKAIQRAETLYYCDTDSIHAENMSAKVSNDLGDWKLEMKADRAAYGGKKLYALLETAKSGKLLHKKVSSKGARLTAAQVFRIARGETVRYKQKAPSMSLRRGFKVIERDIRATTLLRPPG